MPTARSKNRPALRLVFQATQGAADAFVQVEIQTGLSTLGGTGYRVLEIGVETPQMPNINPSGCNLQVALTRQSQASMPDLAERALLYKQSKAMSCTTSGVGYQNPLVERWQPIDDANVIVVEEVIYLQLDSAATGNANAISGYMLIEAIAVSDADRTALIAQSLGNL